MGHPGRPQGPPLQFLRMTCILNHMLNYSLEVRRVVPRPPDVVFAAWTTPSRLEQWISEPGSRVPILELKVGGKYHIDMMYKGKSYPHSGEYLEIDPPRRLKFTWISAGTEGKTTVVTVNFIPRGDATEVVLTHEGLPSEENRASHEQGWTEILDWMTAKV
jgi:uncharacterized protein YndB with AHSA1/START domain